MTNAELFSVAQRAVVQALDVDSEDVKPETTIFGELQAESIDLLDILFRIERATGIKVRSAEVGAYIRGPIPEGSFGDATGFVTREGLAQIKRSMPQIDEQSLAGRLHPEDIIKLFSVGNLVELLAERAAVAAG